MKKITLRSLKKLAKQENLFLNVKSAFSGMTDMCEYKNDGFQNVIYNDTKKGTYLNDVTLGIEGVWSLSGSQLYESYEDESYVGIEVYNSCGTFILAQKR